MTIAAPPAALGPAFEAARGRLDEIADKTFGAWKVPGTVYGVVREGELVHARGLGTLRVGEDATPTPSSVFRIASMTKSFTASTVLLLRDEGRLRLDDEVAAYVPELASVQLPTRDAPPITIRHLLTMTAGFPTDDPWGDRQQGLDLGEFSRLLSGGLSFAWVPGTHFEYSNLGYGILGRLITNVVGREYREVVRDRFLRPLGMASSGYLAEELEPERLARGYVWRDGRFLDEPMDGYGALASMGGMFTTVEDLARWVGGFQDAWPPRDAPEGGHPLSRASRREMQQPMVPADLRLTSSAADGMPDVESLHYGFGLFQIDDVRFGRIVGHAGGYPGFGSHMRWHPASGLGVIAFANGRYAPASLLAKELLGVLLEAEVAPPRRARPNAATQAARAAVEELLEAWHDGRAAELFAMNVELDEPLESRKTFLDGIRERHGRLTPDQAVPPESQSGFHQVWWLSGERGGRVRVEILLTPEATPRVQTFAITSVPEPPDALRLAAAELVAAINAGAVSAAGADWPAGIAIGPDVDLDATRRQLRATEARFGPVELGPPIDGDGAGKATFRLHGARGHLELALTYDAAASCVATVSIVPVKLVAPDLE